ncbi:MAG: alpha/beta hydrolase, partial [Bacteroidota bacterium]
LKLELGSFIKQHLDDEILAQIQNGMSLDDFIKNQVHVLTTSWMYNFLNYDPSIILEKVKCPVLALNGSKDLQVPSKINLDAIETALKKAKNKNITIKELAGLNHLFQECETGSPVEYAKIEQTFSPTALKEIADWIKSQW